MHWPWHRRAREQELDEEIGAHFRMAVQDRIESGESSREAQESVHREFGNIGLVKEITREMWGWSSVERLKQDLHYAARVLRKNAGFTIAAVFMLAGGIGANTAMFSIVHAVLLRPLPFQNPERLFVALEDTGFGGSLAGAVSGPDFADYHEQNRSFEQISAVIPYFTETFQSSKVGPVVVHCAGVSPEFFPALGVKPLLGRLYEPREYHAGEASVILSYRFWQKEFGGDPNIIGRILSFNQGANTVVGVMPPMPDLFPETDVWQSLIPDFDFMKWRNNKFLTVIGRLKPGVTPRQAEQDLSGILRRAPGAGSNASVNLVPLKEYLVGGVEKPLRLLMAAVVLVLIITCANLANLLLARANSRQVEIAVRQGLGASSGRILRQFLTENGVLGLIGGALGIGLASAGMIALLSQNEANLPRGTTIGIDIPVCLFTIAISFGAVLLFGWAPAAGIGKINLNRVLRTGRSEVGRGGKHGLRLLVISEIAGSVVLLAAAGVWYTASGKLLMSIPVLNRRNY